MNTRSVNSAAGVILAAMQQNCTAAGIARALESAGLLMSPEAAADLASVSTDAVRVTEASIAELKREHGESARLRLRVDEVERKYIFDTAELKRRIAELERERHETNESLSEAAEALRANRDRIAELEAAVNCQSIAAMNGARCSLPVRHRGDHRTDDKRQYWSDEFAVHISAEDVAPQVEKLRALLAVQRGPLEDPHDGPLAHSDRVGRALPQREDPARCLKTHRFSPRDGWRMVCGSCDHGKDADCHQTGATR
ncbi:hypothetical protein ACWDE0_21785 [Streptomyces sp. 900105755]